MAIPAGVVKVVLSGTMPGGEIWESGFWMSDTGVTSEAEANALALVIEGTLTASDNSGAVRITAGLLWTAQTTFTTVTTYVYTGGSAAAFVGEFTRPTPLPGTSGNAPHPNQVALVLSLRTGASGRSQRGRMYLPASGASTEATAQLQRADLVSLVNAWATAFSDINSSSAGKVVVVSRVRGAYRQITQLICDSRLDIQRRRANQQAIESNASAVVGP